MVMTTTTQTDASRQAQNLQHVQAQKAFLSTLRNAGEHAPDPRNVADLLERGHKSRSHAAAMLLDVLA
jgi:hypothetical protein